MTLRIRLTISKPVVPISRVPKSVHNLGSVVNNREVRKYPPIHSKRKVGMTHGAGEDLIPEPRVQTLEPEPETKNRRWNLLKQVRHHNAKP